MADLIVVDNRNADVARLARIVRLLRLLRLLKLFKCVDETVTGLAVGRWGRPHTCTSTRLSHTRTSTRLSHTCTSTRLSPPPHDSLTRLTPNRAALCLWLHRMASFAKVKEFFEDIEMASPVLLGIVKLLALTMMILNFLGGIWYDACGHRIV